MTEKSGRFRIIGLVLCLLLVAWGLTDVRKRAHFDPELAAEHPALVSKHRTDLTVYTEAGAAFFDGRDPYQVSNPRGWMYLYPPLFAILMAPLHNLPPQWQGVVWYFFSLAMAWGCYRETLRLLKYTGVPEVRSGENTGKTFRWIQVGVMVAILFPVLDCLQRGQVGILILYLLLLGLRLVLADTSWQKSLLGGVVLSLSIVFKVLPVLPVILLIVLLMVSRSQNKKSPVQSFQVWGAGGGVLAGLVLFFFIVPALFIGWQSNLGHLKTWSRIMEGQAIEASAEGHFSNPRSPRNQSLSNALYFTGTQWAYWMLDTGEPDPWEYTQTAGRFMTSSQATHTVLAIRVFLGLMLIPLAWKRSATVLDRMAVFGLACVAMLIVSPIARGHYFLWQLPAVLFVSLWVWKFMGPQRAVLCAGIPAALSLMHYVFITFYKILVWSKTGILLYGTLGIGTAVWYATLCCMLMAFSPEKEPVTAGIESSFSRET